MIFGRPPNLWLAAFTALFNVAVLAGVDISAGLAAGVNLAAVAVIALVANQPPTLNLGDTYKIARPNGTDNIERTVTARELPRP